MTHGLSAEITHHHGHHSKLPDPLIEGDSGPRNILSEALSLNHCPTTVRMYKYFEWSTQSSELYPLPERLPNSVTKLVDPFTWDKGQKSMILTLACFSTGMAAYAAGAYTSGIDQMSAEWNVNRVALLVGVTTFSTGFAIVPLFLAPLPEVSYLRANIPHVNPEVKMPD